ncbi:MAG: hypothetical protein MUO23_02995 [Anaerolineales bacterium]|nr:hypothetical protein [Anaerolineales bacterium]
MSSSPHPRSSESRQGAAPAIPRWVGIVFPIGLAAAAALVVVAGANRVLHPAVLQAATAAALGLFTGFLTRWSVRGRSLAVQWWIATGASTICLLAVGLVSGGRSGIAPPLVGSAGVRLAELAGLSLAGACSFLALRYRRPRPARPPRASLRQRAQAGLRHGWQRLSPAVAWRGLRLGREQTRPRAASSPRPQPAAASPGASRPRTAVASAGSKPSARTQPAKRGQQKAALPAVRAARRAAKRGVRFTGAEDARCPYCLEPVQPNDRRGSKVCPICHTRHHADCWAVTGVCQMAHLYADDPVRHQGADR